MATPMMALLALLAPPPPLHIGTMRISPDCCLPIMVLMCCMCGCVQWLRFYRIERTRILEKNAGVGLRTPPNPIRERRVVWCSFGVEWALSHFYVIFACVCVGYAERACRRSVCVGVLVCRRRRRAMGVRQGGESAYTRYPSFSF